MIRQRFDVFDGIGPKREQAIRAAGISDWRQFLEASEVPGVPRPLHRSVRHHIREWSNALVRGDTGFFARNLPHAEHWALFDAFASSVMYLDIETTGLSAHRDDVTVVGLYDGRSYRALVNGQGLTARALQEALKGCKLLITYFGTAFDVPFLREKFPAIRWDVPHFDLCFAGRRVGLTGGLKGVERQVGIRRDASIVEVDGYEAVRLWRAYQRGSSAALKKLLRYNEADTRNLAHIAQVVYERLCRESGLSTSE